MARFAWIASELGSATGLPKETVIPQKPPLDEDPECWRDAAYSIRHTPRRYSPEASVCRTGQLPDCRQERATARSARRRHAIAGSPRVKRSFSRRATSMSSSHSLRH
jgi:hypothetical protein